MGTLDNQMSFMVGIQAPGIQRSQREIVGAISSISSGFKEAAGKIQDMGTGIKHATSAAEHELKSMAALGSGIERLTGKTVGFTKYNKILGAANLKQIAQYGILKTVYSKHAKLLDKSILGYKSFTGTILKAKNKYSDFKDVMLEVGDHLQYSAPKYIDKVTDHWEAFAAALVTAGASADGFEFQDKLTRVEKHIALSEEAMKMFTRTSLTASKAVGQMPEEFIPLMEYAYKQGIRLEDQISAIAVASGHLSVASESSAASIGELYTKLVGLGQMDPKNLDKFSSGLIAIKDISPEVVENLLSIGDTTSDMILRFGKFGAKTEDIFGGLAASSAIFQAAFGDSSGMDKFFTDLLNMTEEDVTALSRMQAAMNILENPPDVVGLLKQGKTEQLLKAMAETAVKVKDSTNDATLATLQMNRLAEAFGKPVKDLELLGNLYRTDAGKFDELRDAWDTGSKSSAKLDEALAKQNKTLERMYERVGAAAHRVRLQFGLAMTKITRPIVEFGSNVSEWILDRLEAIPSSVYLAASALTVLVATPVAKAISAWISKTIFLKGAVFGLNKVFKTAFGQALATRMAKASGSMRFFETVTEEATGAAKLFIKPNAGGALFKEVGWKTAGKGLGYAGRAMNFLADATRSATSAMATFAGATADTAGNFATSSKGANFLARALGNVSDDLGKFVVSTADMGKASVWGAEKVANLRDKLVGKGWLRTAFGWVSDLASGFVRLVKAIPGGDIAVKFFSMLGRAISYPFKLLAKGPKLLVDLGKEIPLVGKYFGGFVESLSGVGGWISKLIPGLAKGILPALAKIGVIAFDILNPFLLLYNAVTLIELGLRYGVKVMNFFTNIIGYAVGLVEKIPGYISAAFDWISDLVPRIIDGIASWIADIPNLIAGAFKEAGNDGGLAFVGTLLSHVLRLSKALFKIALSVGWGIVKTVGKLFVSALTLGPKLVFALGDAIHVGLNMIWKQIERFWNWINEKLDSFFTGMWEAASNPDGFSNALLGVLKGVGSWMVDNIAIPLRDALELPMANLNYILADMRVMMEEFFGDVSKEARDAVWASQEVLRQAERNRDLRAQAAEKAAAEAEAAKKAALAESEKTRAMQRAKDLAKGMSNFFTEWKVDTRITSDQVSKLLGRTPASYGMGGIGAGRSVQVTPEASLSHSMANQKPQAVHQEGPPGDKASAQQSQQTPQKDPDQAKIVQGQQTTNDILTSLLTQMQRTAAAQIAAMQEIVAQLTKLNKGQDDPLAILGGTLRPLGMNDPVTSAQHGYSGR